MPFLYPVNTKLCLIANGHINLLFCASLRSQTFGVNHTAVIRIYRYYY